jgi:pyruvate dehydrogenase E2 component (dihydrolipoamide acetyltransferase)
MAEFTMPSLGADMDAGTLVEWLIGPGDRVERGQIVAVVETQKGAIDVEIFEAGTVLELLVPVDEKVPVETVLALVVGEGETEDGVRRAWAAKQGAGSGPASAGVSASGQAGGAQAAGASEAVPAPAGPESGARARISPRARKRAGELGLDLEVLATLQGTGPGGSITSEDVEAAAQATPPARPSAAGSSSSMREAIAAAMARSKREIPHYYLAHTVDLEPALVWLETQNEARPIASRLLLVTLLIRAVAKALVDQPELSGFYRDGAWTPGDGIHVGMAVALRGGGLINPALRDADQGDLDQLNATVLELGGRARRGALTARELGSATITVTSLGERGVDSVHGVIVPPQVAIVGFGTVRLRPWVVDGQVVPRRLIELTLAADHRVSDGHTGARLLARIAELLHAPEAL